MSFRSKPPSSSSYNNRNPNPGLCPACSTINISQAFQNAYALYEGARRGTNTRTLDVYRSQTGPPYLGHFYYVAALGTRLSTPTTTSCRLCTFLLQIYPSARTPSPLGHKLLALCTSESYLFQTLQKSANHRKKDPRPWGLIDHNVFLAVVPIIAEIPATGLPLRWMETELPLHGGMYRLSEWDKSERTRIAVPRLLGEKADLKLARLWLGCCREAHVGCAARKTGSGKGKGKGKVELRGFRAIDCAAKPPVVVSRPWSEPYVVLSYVWGPPSGDWPPTVLDAVEATRRMGERWLWVDRVCIDQGNAEEKAWLISKMGEIYEGAEFTIVGAAGDARTGLPGVSGAKREVQPLIELVDWNGGGQGEDKDPTVRLLGVSSKEFDKSAGDGTWLDMHRFGMQSTIAFSVEDVKNFQKEEELMKEYNISRDHFEIFHDFADDANSSMEVFMPKMQLMAQRAGVPLSQYAPFLLRKLATDIGMPEDMIANLKRRPEPPITRSSRPQKPLPKSVVPGSTLLVSTLPDPRTTIRSSKWAARGWTYQEGVLSNRRLVFTPSQIYWECNGMAVHESLDLLDLYDPTETRFADYMLAGIFDGDIHRVPELQYGYQKCAIEEEEVEVQVRKLDAHISTFTARQLSFDSDALNAFLGVAGRYEREGDGGLGLLLGMPVWRGKFATGKGGLRDTFALSLSGWVHGGTRMGSEGEVYAVESVRRAEFPSWTWVGWKGRVGFSTTARTGEPGNEGDLKEDNMHVQFFKAMTSNSWARGIGFRVWAAIMTVHASDGSEVIRVVDQGTVPAIDQSKKWLLTIRTPFVLQQRALMSKDVQIHLSVRMNMADLKAGHAKGQLISVLVFASTVPFVFNGRVKFLVLRRLDEAMRRWERIGLLVMTVEEHEWDSWKNTAGVFKALPIERFGTDIVLA
ncbi:Heterokaryon incompatibility protein [Rutstroemia sp. NJR-2017a BVV2]|nr:Heterokaryon incompatibility protein [Rutstroemia sp. NJR-2017a BVV2]